MISVFTTVVELPFHFRDSNVGPSAYENYPVQADITIKLFSDTKKRTLCSFNVISGLLFHHDTGVGIAEFFDFKALLDSKSEISLDGEVITADSFLIDSHGVGIFIE